METAEMVIKVLDLEKRADAMRDIPQTVAAVSAKVDGLEKSLYREVDGLREQQKAHKEEAAKSMEETREKMDEGFSSINTVLGSINNSLARRGFYKELFTNVGSALVGLAVIAEAAKAVMAHI